MRNIPWPRLRSGTGCCVRWLYWTRHIVNNNNNNNNNAVYSNIVGELSGGAGRRIAYWTSDGLAPFTKGRTSPVPSLRDVGRKRQNQPTNQPYCALRAVLWHIAL